MDTAVSAADISDTDPAAQTPRPRRRSRPAHWLRIAIVTQLTLAAVALLVGLWLAHHPGLETGSYSQTGAGINQISDGYVSTRYLVHAQPGARAELLVSVRNAGRLPVTLTGLAEEQTAVRLQARFATLDYSRPIQLGQPTHRQVTIEPGQEAAVFIGVDAGECGQGPGDLMSFETLPLRVEVLGLTTTQQVPLNLPLTLAGPTVSAASLDQASSDYQRCLERTTPSVR